MVVLVHGNPETADVWGPLVDRLDGREVVCLSPPGFGAPVPDGFEATMDGSAAEPAVARRGAGLARAATRPGLSLLATEDHMVGTDPQRRRAAELAGARTEVLEGLGHWWMSQDPPAERRCSVGSGTRPTSWPSAFTTRGTAGTSRSA